MILADFRSGKALAYFDRLFTSSDGFGNCSSAGIMAIDPRAIEQVIPSESDAEPMHDAAIRGAFYETSPRPRSEKRTLCTEPRKSLGTWLREISSCSCLTFLPGSVWVLLSKICQYFFSALYNKISFSPNSSLPWGCFKTSHFIQCTRRTERTFRAFRFAGDVTHKKLPIQMEWKMRALEESVPVVAIVP